MSLYNQQLPQAALASRTPLQAMKDWHKLRPELFKKSHTTVRDVTPECSTQMIKRIYNAKPTKPTL
jgi:hypothetical protein